MMQLESLRHEIDKIDDEIAKLLDRRISVAIEVGKIKKATNMPIYAPAREEQIFERITKDVSNKDEIRKIYEAILTVVKNKILIGG
ncbi:MAG: chorismate mutase [Deferribacteraceae bacterium]|jgi:monofunctional chorismate mutase|nr:chorismate mutase [Deferribacteraceae bacterium]